MKKDLVSIVVPTYNDEPYLRKALDDLLNQTYQNIEILVVDDGSTDETANIVNEYVQRDKRVKYFFKENGGTGSALNVGFLNVQGEFGTWVSSDDRKELHMIERLVNFLQKNRDIEFVFSSFYSEYLEKNIQPFLKYKLNSKGYKENPHTFYEKRPRTHSKEAFAVDEFTESNYRQCILGVNYMFTMNLKNQIGDYLTIPGEDYYMAAIMGLKTRVGYIDEVLGVHKNPPDSLSMENRACVAAANVKTRSLILKEYRKWHLKEIPKIAHFYWGSPKMSYMRYNTIKSFKKLNPDWSAVLYVPSEVSQKLWKDTMHRSDSLDYTSELDYLERLKSEIALKVVEVDFTRVFKSGAPAHRSDYLRWILLYSTGGLWCDMDILFHKPMNEIYFNKIEHIDIDTIVCWDYRHEISGGTTIGFLLSSKGNPYYKDLSLKSKYLLARESLNEAEELKYQAFGADMINKMYKNEKIVRRHYPSCKVLNLDPDCVYYYDFKNLPKIYEEENFKNLPERSIGVHWYGGHPDSQKMNNMLNDENYKDFSNTYTEILQMLEGAE
ncbi:hypothetical protein CMI37_23770 [Candidatus Pacearchaeota archaeon]|nr:hypothetical protein [Candidatus Pacearchaeota archaeon]|tara:strand:- start:1217 stop:2872 length:1656 start_codon:yes stop_codon:yes gene_type:complete